MRYAVVVFVCLALGLPLALTGCSSSGLGESLGMGGGDTEVSSSPPASQEESPDSYYDFDDIVVPREMDLDKAASFILETPRYKSGVLVFNGPVERLSLTDYFSNNMAKDNWRLRSAFKSQRTVLLYEKPGRYAVINITDERFSTLLEIWVTPRLADAGESDAFGPDPIGDSPEVKPLQTPAIREQGLSN